MESTSEKSGNRESENPGNRTRESENPGNRESENPGNRESGNNLSNLTIYLSIWNASMQLDATCVYG